jgi:DNA-binding GntR family transcriptional regulator
MASAIYGSSPDCPSYTAESDREHAAWLKAVHQGDVAVAQSRVTKHLLDTGERLHRFPCQDAKDAG